MKARPLDLFYSGGKFVAGDMIATDHRLGGTIGRPQKEMKKRANRGNGRVICQPALAPVFDFNGSTNERRHSLQHINEWPFYLSTL